MTSSVNQDLDRGVSLVDVVMLGAGSAIGAAIFTVLGPAAQVGGASMLVSLLIAAIPMGIFALVYGYLSSAVPMTAASFEWQRRFVHPVFAFGVVWLRVLSNAVVMALLGRILLDYLIVAIPVPRTPAIIAALLLVFAINYVGVKVAARAQTILMIALLLLFAIYAAVGTRHMQPHLLVEAVISGWLPVLAPIPLMIQLFLSIETATEIGGEVHRPERNIPLGLALALLLTTAVYGLIAFTTLSVLGPVGLAESSAPLLDAARQMLGGWAVPLVVVAATVALFKSMNAVFLVYSRFLYAMAVEGELPSALARIHPRFATPHIAIIAAFAMSLACLLLPEALIFLLLAISVPTMAKYFGSCAAAFIVATRRPDIVARARLKFPAWTVRWLGIAGMATAIVIAALGLSSDIRPYLLMIGWLAIGLAYLFFKKRGARRS
ncbi:APC family permease [Rhizorhabdus dicambivorans]|nr:APC family permease [Rhizorhabdus dicambivorans]